MASFDIKSELDHHEVTNAVDQANRVLQNRFDFKGAGAEFLLIDQTINLSANEEFQIHQMLPILNESLAKRGIDLKSLKPNNIDLSGGSAKQTINLQEGIDKELAKKITTIVKQSKSKVQASIREIVSVSQVKKEMTYKLSFSLSKTKIMIYPCSL